MGVRKRIQDERAQAVIEFALLSTVLMLIFLGTVDFSRFLYYTDAIRSAARVGAETGMNHCVASSICGQDSSAVTKDFVAQRVYCEAEPELTLQPAPSSCTPPSCSGSLLSTCGDPCSGTCSTNICSRDICVSYSPSATTGATVTVSVGYDFQPISPYLRWLFTAHSCYSGDSTSTNGHTLCATSEGRVS